MIFAITAMKLRGKHLQQHEIRTMTPVIGDLIVGLHECELGRMTTVGTISKSGSGPEPLPPLLDCHLSHMGPMGATAASKT